MSENPAAGLDLDNGPYAEELAWDEDQDPFSPLRDRILAALVVFAIVGWTAAYVGIHLDQMRAGASGSLWLSWIAEWMIPTLLVVVIWQIAIRSGHAEQNRFADTAALLSRESAELELRLGTVNRELSLARDFIASQSRDLESLGRLAADRLTTSASALQALIESNGAQIDRIGEVGSTAISNMERLRDQLPVLANSARDMTNQIGNAGNVAKQQLENLVTGFERLDQFGNAGEKHINMISARMTETLDLLDRHSNELGDAASDQFALLQRRSEEFRTLLKVQDDEALKTFRSRADELTQFLEQRSDHLVKVDEVACNGMRERVTSMISDCDRMLREMVAQRVEASNDVRQSIEALEARLTEAIQNVAKVDEIAMGNARNRMAALAEDSSRIDATIGQHATAFDADLQRRRDILQQREMTALAELEERFAAFDQKVLAREEGQLAHADTIATRSEQLAQRLARFDEELGELGNQVEAARDGVGNSADMLTEKLAESRAILAENSQAITGLTEAGTNLLEVVRAGAGLADGELAEAIGRAEARLSAFRSDAETVRELVETAEGRGAALAEHIGHAHEQSASTLGLLEQLEGQIGELAEKSGTVTAKTRDEMQAAFDMLAMSTSNVLQDLRNGHGDAIREIAEQIAERSNTAIAGALREQTVQTIAEIETSARAASDAGRETTAQLRDQLSKVNELTGNLEQRVAAARNRAEDQIGDDFARRMALITEALNSGAIDIAKAFDNDVSDTQWANYLRGDRGIFTRRAVRLLDKQETRAVFEFYEGDGVFRETVNRYIHDFEAMLRSVLSTRDGNALAVTLLSSDVGKLYVCLAQAIDRLRD